MPLITERTRRPARKTRPPKLTAPLKWHGGKVYLAPAIVALMPPHVHYVEAYGGGLRVLFERDPDDQRLWLPPHKGVSELVNDIDGDLMNFWAVLRDRELFPAFGRACQATPLGRPDFDLAGVWLETRTDLVDRAWALFVRARQSRAGSFKGFTSLTRNRLRRGVNGNVSEWIGAVDGLAAIHERLRPVVVENMPALDLIRREDSPGSLFYLDPPYLHETRSTKDAYRFEMNNRDHAELLDVLKAVKGKVMLSGYPSALYDTTLAGWNRRTFDKANHSAGGGSKRRMTECVWCNF
jgi:DNA adenine methylase